MNVETVVNMSLLSLLLLYSFISRAPVTSFEGYTWGPSKNDDEKQDPHDFHYRSVAPIVGGGGFAWSITNGLNYPLDLNFTFTVFSVVAMLSACVNVFLPDSLNRQKKEILPAEKEPLTTLSDEKPTSV